MNAATTTTVASTIAPQTASIINAVLGSAGLSTDIDTLLADSAALTITNKAIQSMTDELWASKRHADEIQQQLDIERRKAATAMPSTITLTSQSATIPDGTMQMIDASSVFPQLGKLKLPVPSFQWQGDHPDVPKVNDAYIFRKGMLLSVLRNLANGDNAWLQGHTGSGKTTFIEQVAARLGWPVARVAYDSNVDRAELVGRMQLIPDGKGGTESKWLPGILERAISGGYILLCDEMDAGHPNALYTLQPLLEGKGLTLLEDGGRMVVRHPFSRIVATGNTTGNGDPSGLYPACRILSAATLDRFQDFVQVPYLTEAEETNLLKSQAPSLKASVIETIVKFGSELRKAFVSGETPISFSPRRSVAFARHVEDLTGYGLKDEKLCMSMAFRSKLYDAAPEEHRQRLLEIGRAKIAGLDIEAALMDEAN
jgi:cobaltochelatase CobS